jgi:hypothetical protein
MYRNTAAAIDVAEVNSPGTVPLSLWRVIHRDQIVAHGATSIASGLLQAPTKFETVFNLKDAKALSLQLEVQRGSDHRAQLWLLDRIGGFLQCELLGGPLILLPPRGQLLRHSST